MEKGGGVERRRKEEEEEEERKERRKERKVGQKWTFMKKGSEGSQKRKHKQQLETQTHLAKYSVRFEPISCD